MRTTPRLIAGLLLALAALGCRAADCPFDERPTDPDRGQLVLILLSDADCLGNPNVDTDPLAATVRGAIGKKSALENVAGITAAFDALADAARAEAGGGGAWLAVWTELEGTRRQLAELPRAQGPDAFQDIANRAILGRWRVALEAERPVTVGGQTVRPLAPVACKPGGDCAAFLSQLRLVRVFRLVTVVRDYVQNVDVMRQAAKAQLELARWEAYRTQSQHQYWWELGVNSWRMERDKGLCPRDASDTAQGFCAVPTSQFIVLHPDGGLRWSRRADNSKELQPALVVSLLGQHFIEWESASSATIKRQWGYALAASYSQVDGRPEWAYGPMLQWNGYNLAITRGPGGRWGLMVNLNLANRYFERKADYADPLKNLNKPGFLDLLMR